jgi:hypothetical protein
LAYYKTKAVGTTLNDLTQELKDKRGNSPLYLMCMNEGSCYIIKNIIEAYLNATEVLNDGEYLPFHVAHVYHVLISLIAVQSIQQCNAKVKTPHSTHTIKVCCAAYPEANIKVQDNNGSLPILSTLLNNNFLEVDSMAAEVKSAHGYFPAHRETVDMDFIQMIFKENQKS